MVMGTITYRRAGKQIKSKRERKQCNLRVTQGNNLNTGLCVRHLSGVLDLFTLWTERSCKLRSGLGGVWIREKALGCFETPLAMAARYLIIILGWSVRTSWTKAESLCNSSFPLPLDLPHLPPFQPHWRNPLKEQTRAKSLEKSKQKQQSPLLLDAVPQEESSFCSSDPSRGTLSRELVGCMWVLTSTPKCLSNVGCKSHTVLQRQEATSTE